MDLRRLSAPPWSSGWPLLAGCVTPTKPDPPDAPKAVAADAAGPGVPAGPPPPTRWRRLRAFIADDGLAASPARPGQAARLTAAWNNKVIYAPDPTHGGDPVPGLMARLWVFGPDDRRSRSSLDGELRRGRGTTARRRRAASRSCWRCGTSTAEAAKKFRRQDFFGGGYNLFLPWSQYNVDLKQVNVVARFNGADGRSLVSTPETLTLDHSATLQRAAEKLGVARPEVGTELPKVETRPQGPEVK